MKDREMIVGVLRGLCRRLWIHRAIREAAFFVCVVLACLVYFKLIERALATAVPLAGTAIRFALLAAFAAFAVDGIRRSVRGIPLREAAAEADTRALLKDEMKSAHWFLSEGLASPFVDLQMRRAAATAAGLDLSMLAPHRLPANAFPAAGLGLVLAGLIWMTPQLSRSWDADREAATAQPRESADLRELLKDAPQDAELAKLDLALRALQQAESSPGERMRALTDVRDAIDQANMDASAAREELARLAESMKADPKFESVAQAMNEGRLEDAMAQLHKLRDSAAAVAREDPVSDPAENSGMSEVNGGQAAQSTGRDLTGKNAAVNQDAINRVINTLEQAGERIQAQNRVNSVKRRMEDSLVATRQRGQLTASQFDNRSNAPNPTPAPETGNADVRGGALFRQAAIAREEGDTARDGSQAGDASGDSPALPLQGAATKRLDAQLKREIIAQEQEAGEDPEGKGNQAWFYSARREQKSMLQAEDVRLSAGVARESATEHDRIPVRQKNIVKNYFLNLHESEKK
jgi:hypothetical protein